MSNIPSYTHPEVLCETDWVANNISNAIIRILEVDYDPENAYLQGHLPEAYLVWWKKDINDADRRDIINKHQFEALMSKVGATSDTELVLYGDFNNWFAAFAFWVFRYYGHKKIKIMNGGRKKWELEKRAYTKQDPSPAEGRFSKYIAQPPDEGVRAYLPDVKRAMEKAETVLVDVRSPKEFTRRNYSSSRISHGACTKRRSYPGRQPMFHGPKQLKRQMEPSKTFKNSDHYMRKRNNSRQGDYCILQIGERSFTYLVRPEYSSGYPSVTKL